MCVDREQNWTSCTHWGQGYDYMQCVNGLSVLWILPAGSGNWRQLDNDVWLSRHYQDINVTLSQWLYGGLGLIV